MNAVFPGASYFEAAPPGLKGAGVMTDQRGRILNLLAGANGAWVPLPAILALGIAQYGARIHELRRLHFQIENRVIRGGDGVRRSWFRLVDSPTAPAV